MHKASSLIHCTKQTLHLHLVLVIFHAEPVIPSKKQVCILGAGTRENVIAI